MRGITGILIAVALALALPAGAYAAFPGANGKIAYASLRDGNYEIYTVNPDGSGLTRLTNDPAMDFAPAWSPDGSRIAFWSDRDGTSDIYSMNAGGGQVTQLTNSGAYNVWPAWSPDGASIAFASDDGIFKIPAEGGPRSPVVQSDCPPPEGGSCHKYNFPSWSPDGQWITVQKRDFMLIAGQLEQDTFGVARVSADGSGAIVDVAGDGQNSDWSPSGARIAFDKSHAAPSYYDVWSVNSDGTAATPLTSDATNEFYPAWSPDGSRIAFAKGLGGGPPAIYIMDSSGANQVQVTTDFGTAPDWQPLPSADVLAALTDSPDPAHGGDLEHYSAQAKNLVGPQAATGVTLTLNLPTGVFYVSATPTQGTCSQAAGVVTCNFGSLPVGATASVDVKTEVRNRNGSTTITATTNVSANENDPVPGNNTASQNTQASFGGYARAKSATPTLLPLVIAYKSCGGAEATERHAPNLSFQSCPNPQQASGWLTAGTGDSNARPTNFTGSVKLKVLGEPLPQDPGNGDQSDVAFDVLMTDVRNKADLTDYTGQIRVDSALRLTDHDNGAGDFTSATGPTVNLQVPVTCTATANANIGSDCNLSTTYEAIVPGAVKEGQKTIWEMGQLKLIDGGADGNLATSPNTLFAVQGVFVP